MKYIILLVLCGVFAAINQFTPEQWYYLFGFGCGITSVVIFGQLDK